MMEKEETVFVYWDEDLYITYHDLFKIKLWKKVVKYHEADDIETEELSRSINLGDQKEISEDGARIGIYWTKDLVMEIPKELYLVFSNLKEWKMRVISLAWQRYVE